MKPYITKLMKEAHEKGTPVMRPLFYDFSSDKNCWNNETEYMFGPKVLVAPVMEAGQTTKEVYLPEGSEWVNAWTGEKYQGGSTATVNAPLDEIPLFTRDGFKLEL